MLTVLLAVDAVDSASAPPCDPNATAEVKAVLATLRATQLAGQCLSGQVESDQHDDAAGGSRTFTDRDWSTVYNLTGRHPAIWGSQFLWGADEWAQPYRQAMVERATALWNSADGRVLTQINFHLCPPTAEFSGRTCSWDDIEGSGHNPPSLGDAMLTAGSAEHTIWLAQLDVMAGFLKQLADRKVPVLWRPFHEANGAWFWWGQQPRFVELWAQMWRRFTETHTLHNLVWTYGPSGQFPVGPMFPAGMADVLGQDIYAKTDDARGFTTAQYDDLRATAAGRPVALTEVGLGPGSSVLASQNHSYFLMWGGFEKNGNTPAGLRALYDNPRVVTQQRGLWLARDAGM